MKSSKNNLWNSLYKGLILNAFPSKSKVNTRRKSKPLKIVENKISPTCKLNYVSLIKILRRHYKNSKKLYFKSFDKSIFVYDWGKQCFGGKYKVVLFYKDKYKNIILYVHTVKNNRLKMKLEITELNVLFKYLKNGGEELKKRLFIKEL